jgi:hypothetical protein
MTQSSVLKRRSITNKKKDVFVPYKTYLWGLIKIKDGWKDIGISGPFSTGETRQYSYSFYGHTYSGEEEITYHKVCRICRVIFRLCLWKSTGEVYFYCPNCGRMSNVKYDK